jgi:hypothetical protein
MTKQHRYGGGGCLDTLYLAATLLPQLHGIVHNGPKYRNDHSEQPTAQAAEYNILQLLVWFSAYFYLTWQALWDIKDRMQNLSWSYYFYEI